jgi:hypothetical protein
VRYLSPLLVVALGTLVAAASGAGVATLPADVQAGLAADSIVVGAPTNAPGSLPVGPRKALRIVTRHFGGFGGSRPAVYLVRIVGHPDPTKPPAPGVRGWTDIRPLGVGDLVWVGVIRGARIPTAGRPGRNDRATLAVLVQTTQPRTVVGITLAPP